MTEPDPYSDSETTRSTRRYVRRRGGAGALFFPLGLIPLLGLVLLTLFALFPFAHGLVQHRAETAAYSALQQGGETWASVRASGQWVTLEGNAPSEDRANRAITLVRDARAPTWLGSAKPVTRVRDLTTLATPSTSEPESTDTTADEAPPLPATVDTPQPETDAPARITRCNEQLARMLAATQFEFASGSSDVGTQNEPLLDDLAEELANCPGSILIEGHTDSTGSDITNQFLSRARADAIREALLTRGIASERITARGFGSSQPLASNTTPEGRARNRRIEIEISASDED
ncbi:MAG: OmpA family protein [Henriciella sp.]|nr:OmpA family protein [Henriciella sp.]